VSAPRVPPRRPASQRQSSLPVPTSIPRNSSIGARCHATVPLTGLPRASLSASVLLAAQRGTLPRSHHGTRSSSAPPDTDRLVPHVPINTCWAGTTRRLPSHSACLSPPRSHPVPALWNPRVACRSRDGGNHASFAAKDSLRSSRGESPCILDLFLRNAAVSLASACFTPGPQRPAEPLCFEPLRSSTWLLEHAPTNWLSSGPAEHALAAPSAATSARRNIVGLFLGRQEASS
jgi:hypothetical protein